MMQVKHSYIIDSENGDTSVGNQNVSLNCKKILVYVA